MEAVGTSNTEAQEATHIPEAEENNNRKSPFGWLIPLLSVVLVGIVILNIVLINKKNNNSTTDEGRTEYLGEATLEDVELESLTTAADETTVETEEATTENVTTEAATKANKPTQAATKADNSGGSTGGSSGGSSGGNSGGSSGGSTSGKATFTANFKFSNNWESNGKKFYQLNVTVNNTSSGTINSWAISKDLGASLSIESFWNCTASASGSKLTLKPVDYNSTISKGGSVQDIGLIISTTASLSDFNYKGTGSGSGGGSSGGNSGGSSGGSSGGGTAEKVEPYKLPTLPAGSPVSNHGQLKLSGTNIVDKNGKKYQLMGPSTHGIHWFPDYVNQKAFNTFKKYGANMVRLAMYTAEGGYCEGNKSAILDTLYKGVDYATKEGMYVIIDWHILHDNNPNTYIKQAKSFFRTVSKKYKNNVNVIYEICNEPNGGTSWSDIKKYADTIIPIIRANSPNALIIVGTPTWSQDVDQVIGHQVKQPKNVLYAVHFYAATHKDDLRNKVKKALSKKIPVFISEFSICDASGNGGIDYTSANAWKKLINDNNLSFACWSLCNKAETSALIKSGCSKLSGWGTNDLSDAGIWFRKWLTERVKVNG